LLLKSIFLKESSYDVKSNQRKRGSARVRIGEPSFWWALSHVEKVGGSGASPLQIETGLVERGS
jgi:hypothetical protein